MTKSRLTLSQKFSLGALIVLCLSIALSVALVGMLAHGYWRARENQQFITLYEQLLMTGTRLSAERGPSNSVLGEEPGSKGPFRDRLVELRGLSDVALGTLARNAPDMGLERGPIVRVREKLDSARREIDRIAALPKAQRSSDEIQAAIRSMFAVVDSFGPIAAAAAGYIVAQDQSLSGPILMGQILTELREHAGRYSSFLMPFIAKNERLPPAVLEQVSVARGRILALWQLGKHRAGLFGYDAALAQISRDVETSYLAGGLTLVGKLLAEGEKGGDYSLTTSELTTLYVASFAPIEKLRATFLAAAVSESAATRDRALQWLLIVAVVAVVIAGQQIAIIWAGREWVFRPLRGALNEIVALTEDTNVEATHVPEAAHELRHLFDSLQALRLQLGERSRTTAYLREQAETDGLTGLLNRHVLDRFGQGAPDEANDRIGLILLDIDHFKSINDNFGHLGGDAVLKSVAALIGRNIPPESLAARYGGEEIAIVVPAGDIATTAVIAEGLRVAIERWAIELDDKQCIRITASFGAAVGSRGAAGWPRIMRDADAALYEAKARGRNMVVAAGNRTIRLAS